MDNNLENKAKFFAQYLLTDSVVVPAFMSRDQKKICKTTTLTVGLLNAHYESKAYLQLKPLSSITDEDLLWFYHQHSALIGYDYTMDFKGCLSSARNTWLPKNGYNDLQKHPVLVDYLRSKGYALPYMGLSVETMVEYEWIKLTE